jgi:hypothetical protein
VDCGENPLPKAVGDAILSLLEELPAWPRKRAFAHRFAMLDRSGRKTSFAACADWPDWDRLEIETAHGNAPPAVLMFPRDVDVVREYSSGIYGKFMLPRNADAVLVGGPGGWMVEIPVGRREAIQSLLRTHRGAWIHPPVAPGIQENGTTGAGPAGGDAESSHMEMPEGRPPFSS